MKRETRPLLSLVKSVCWPLLLLVSVMSASHAFSQPTIEIDGSNNRITGIVTWPAGSTVNIHANVMVEGELKVEAGVQMNIDNGRNISVTSGTLRFNGTDDQMIELKDSTPADSIGWGGIHLLAGSDASHLSHAIIERSNSPAVHIDFSSPTLSRCAIRTIVSVGPIPSKGGLGKIGLSVNTGSPTIADCIIQDISYPAPSLFTRTGAAGKPSIGIHLAHRGYPVLLGNRIELIEGEGGYTGTFGAVGIDRSSGNSPVLGHGGNGDPGGPGDHGGPGGAGGDAAGIQIQDQMAPLIRNNIIAHVRGGDGGPGGEGGKGGHGGKGGAGSNGLTGGYDGGNGGANGSGGNGGMGGAGGSAFAIDVGGSLTPKKVGDSASASEAVQELAEPTIKIQQNLIHHVEGGKGGKGGVPGGNTTGFGIAGFGGDGGDGLAPFTNGGRGGNGGRGSDVGISGGGGPGGQALALRGDFFGAARLEMDLNTIADLFSGEAGAIGDTANSNINLCAGGGSKGSGGLGGFNGSDGADGQKGADGTVAQPGSPGSAGASYGLELRSAPSIPPHRLRNNILARGDPQNGAAIALLGATTSASLDLDYNLLHQFALFYDGATTGTHDLIAEPLFMDPVIGDYRLASGSPGIDAGANAEIPADLEIDLAGQPRMIDGNGDAVETVDLGAYEAPPKNICHDWTFYQ